MSIKYKPRTLSGAAKRVAQLQTQRDERESLLKQWSSDRIALAKLAATGPAFVNPLEAIAAVKLRDQILMKAGMNPDGTFLQSR